MWWCSIQPVETPESVEAALGLSRADRVLVVNGGRLVFDGVPSDLQRDGSMEDSFYELTGPAGSDGAAENGAAPDPAAPNPGEVA